MMVMNSDSTASDIDNNTYKTVQIGSKIWLAENLAVKKFKNGDPILEAKTDKYLTELTESVGAI